jgi:hypothetical protein
MAVSVSVVRRGENVKRIVLTGLLRRYQFTSVVDVTVSRRLCQADSYTPASPARQKANSRAQARL